MQGLARWTFTRSGTFKLKPSGTFFCGPRGPLTSFFYEVTIVSTQLDSSGFVIDGTVVGTICECPIVNQSCEMQAALFCGQIYDAIEKQGTLLGLESIAVTFGGQPNAFATYTYHHHS